METLNIIIAGAYGAGKSTFILNFPPPPSKRKHETPTTLDYGSLMVEPDLYVSLFCAPGQERFSYIWEILAEGMVGFILLVDSTRPETYRETRRILEMFTGYAPVPYVVAANKQDLAGAFSPNQVRRLLNLSDDVLPCIAADKTSANNALLELLRRILQATKPPPPLVFPSADEMKIRRASISDVKRLAHFLRTCLSAQTRQAGVYASFADYGYLLAEIDGQIAGIARFYVENLVLCFQLFVAPQAPQKVTPSLIESLHQQAQELRVEFVFTSSFGDEHLLKTMGYQVFLTSDLDVPAWYKIVQHTGAGRVLGKKLSDEQVKKPI